MIADIKKSAEEKMKKTLETLKNDLGKIRTGRAHTGLLDHVMVDYYGTPTPINGVANVTLLDARTLAVTPWEKKMVSAIDKAIRDSDLGLNPATMGETVRVPMPALTEERRKDLIKVVHKEGEGARVAVRNIRRDANNHLKDLLKQKKVAEDEERRAQDDVQKLTDRHIAEVDRLLAAKEADLIAGYARASCPLPIPPPSVFRLPPRCLATSPLLWTATGAGRSNAICRASPATGAASRTCAARCAHAPKTASNT